MSRELAGNLMQWVGNGSVTGDAADHTDFPVSLASGSVGFAVLGARTRD